MTSQCAALKRVVEEIFLKKNMYTNTTVSLKRSRESIAYPYIDFQKFTDINMDIHDFWMSVFNYPYKYGYPY